jgi:predicted transcriptional regulator
MCLMGVSFLSLSPASASAVLASASRPSSSCRRSVASRVESQQAAQVETGSALRYRRSVTVRGRQSQPGEALATDSSSVRRPMSVIKEKMVEVIRNQPDDASYEEIMRELAFERMIERGLADSRSGRVISNEELGRRIAEWQS